jgi:hypothetical protein
LYSSLFCSPRVFRFEHKWLHLYPAGYDKIGTLFQYRFPAAEDGMLQSGMDKPKKELGFVHVHAEVTLTTSLAYDYMKVDPTRLWPADSNGPQTAAAAAASSASAAAAVNAGPTLGVGQAALLLPPGQNSTGAGGATGGPALLSPQPLALIGATTGGAAASTSAPGVVAGGGGGGGAGGALGLTGLPLPPAYRPILLRPEEPLEFHKTVFKKNVRRLKRWMEVPLWFRVLCTLFEWRSPLLTFYALAFWSYLCFRMPAWQFPLVALGLVLSVNVWATRFRLRVEMQLLVHAYTQDALPYEHAGEGSWSKFKRYKGHLAKTAFTIGRVAGMLEKVSNMLNFSEVPLSVFVYTCLFALALLLSLLLYFVPAHTCLYLLGLQLFVRGGIKSAKQQIERKHPQWALWKPAAPPQISAPMRAATATLPLNKAVTSTVPIARGGSVGAPQAASRAVSASASPPMSSSAGVPAQPLPSLPPSAGSNSNLCPPSLQQPQQLPAGAPAPSSSPLPPAVGVDSGGVGGASSGAGDVVILKQKEPGLKARVLSRSKVFVKRVLLFVRRFVRFVKSLFIMLRHLYVRSPDYCQSQQPNSARMCRVSCAGSCTHLNAHAADCAECLCACLFSADEAAHRILCQRAIQDESADAQAYAAAVAAAVTASLTGNSPHVNAKGKPETYAAYQALQAQQQQQQPQSSKQQPQQPQPQSRDKSPSMQARRLLFGSAAASVAPSPLASPTKRAGSFSLGVSGSTPINSKQAAAAALSPRRSSDAPEGPAALLRLNVAPRLAVPQTAFFYAAAPQGASGLPSPLSGRPAGPSAAAGAVPTTVPASAIVARSGGATAAAAAAAAAAGVDARRLSFTRAATEHQLLHRTIASPTSLSRNDSGIDSEGEDGAAAASDKARRSAAAAAAPPNAAPSTLRNRVSAAAAFDQELPPPQWH